MPGKVIQMPARSKSSDETVLLQEAVMIFHESANCPGMLSEESSTDRARVEIRCSECNVVIGDFSSKEWRSIVEFLALLPSHDVA